MSDAPTLAPVLWLCTVLLIGRVVGQLIVAWSAPSWLPPMEQWQSGRLSYPKLVAGQVVVLILMIWISADFTRDSGVWVQPRRWLGWCAVVWSVLYFGAMVVRYGVRMTRRPDQRWLGGTIPIIFHSVVAAFQCVFGIYHLAPR